MKLNSYELTVLVNDRAVTEYQHNSSTFIEGRKGSEFKVRFKNNTGRRVLVVPSVDGKSVFDGERATADSRGYVVAAYGSIEIPGWTLDAESVAKFTFEDKEKSYSALTAEEGEEVITGVIGVLVYKEKITRSHYSSGCLAGFPSNPSYPPNARGGWSLDDPIGGAAIVKSVHNSQQTRSMMASQSSVLASTNTATSISADSTPYEMGAGFGEKTDFKTTTTSFERGDMSEMAIYYDSRRNLEKRGIQVVDNKVAEAPLPSAFAGVSGCKPPKGWQG